MPDPHDAQAPFLQGGDLVAQVGGLLELETLGGGAHLRVEPGHQGRISSAGTYSSSASRSDGTVVVVRS